jgi:hypothetical protein
MREEKRLAQIDSAERSLITNLICMFVLFVACTLVAFLPAHISRYFAAVTFTLLKGLMPILSTVANFGTVKSVYLQYKEHISQLHV